MELVALRIAPPIRRAGRRILPRSATAREERPTNDELLASLLERARAGEAAAFAEVFTRFEADVERVCRRLLGPGAAADDAAAEAFLRARRGLGDYDPSRPFRPWLLGIASHHCIDQLRRRRTEARLFDAADAGTRDLPDPGPSPLRRAAGAEQRAQLLRAVEKLPEKYRLPLVLRYWSELDYAAIAEVLGVSREQVGTLVYRAKRRLRDALSAAGVGP